MKHSIILSAITAIAGFTTIVRAQTPTLIYSFENGDSPNNLDGFAPNGGGATVTQSTIGATDGSSSLKFTMVAGAFFSGPLTANIVPALLSPETEAINFDLTIPATGQFTGTFADIGISEFGTDNSEPPNTSNDQLQSTPNANKNIDLAPGTYNLTIPLQALDNPITGEGPVPFSSCFGSDPSSQLVALTGFEIYINKSTDVPLTVYIDNIKAEPLLGDTNDDFNVNSTDLNTVIANFGKTVTGGYADGDFNGDGVVNADDFALFKLGAAEYNFLTFQPLPEPACLAIVGGGFVALAARRRR
jgi:hypothetical protein